MTLINPNKKEILSLFVAEIESKIEVIINAAEQARDTATHSESVAKSKYETFGLEASYLAHGQSLRAEQLMGQLQELKQTQLIQFQADDAISIGALVELVNQDQMARWVFLTNKANTQVSYNSKIISAISIDSPLAQALLGQRLDEEVVLNIAGDEVIYEITAIY